MRKISYNPKRPGRTIFWLMLIGLLNNFNTIAQPWQKKYHIHGTKDYVWAAEAYDKGFYIAGSNDIYESGIMLYKTDINGKILWQRLIANELEDPGLCGIAVTADHGLIISGANVKTDTTGDVFLIKLNSCGEKEWSKTYTLDQYTIGGPVMQMKNGDYEVSAYVSIYYDTGANRKSYNTFFFRTDPHGNLKWQIFDQMGSETFMLDKDENTIVTGLTYLEYPGIDPGVVFIKSNVMKLDSLGKIIWANAYSVEKHIDCASTATVQTQDNGYLTASVKRNSKPPVSAPTFYRPVSRSTNNIRGQ